MTAPSRHSQSAEEPEDDLRRIRGTPIGAAGVLQTRGGASISLIMWLVTYDMTWKWLIGGTKSQLNLTARRPLGRGDEHECVHRDKEPRFHRASQMYFPLRWGLCVCVQANT